MRCVGHAPWLSLATWLLPHAPLGLTCPLGLPSITQSCSQVNAWANKSGGSGGGPPPPGQTADAEAVHGSGGSDMLATLGGSSEDQQLAGPRFTIRHGASQWASVQLRGSPAPVPASLCPALCQPPCSLCSPHPAHALQRRPPRVAAARPLALPAKRERGGGRGAGRRGQQKREPTAGEHQPGLALVRGQRPAARPCMLVARRVVCPRAAPCCACDSEQRGTLNQQAAQDRESFYTLAGHHGGSQAAVAACMHSTGREAGRRDPRAVAAAQVPYRWRHMGAAMAL